MPAKATEHVQRLLTGPCCTARDRLPVTWSDEKKETLRRAAKQQIAVHSPIDVSLAEPLLWCSDGEFARAEQEIIRLLQDKLDILLHDNELFISFLNAVFVVQRLDVVGAMLKDRYGFPASLTISVEPEGHGIGLVQWEISSSKNRAEHRFIFDARAYTRDDTRNEILAFQWEFPLLSHYANSLYPELGHVLINRHDIGVEPGLAYCDSRPEFFLIPDYIFVSTGGYRHARDIFRQKRLQWADRKPVAFWRGATTGIPLAKGDWESLPRAKLCRLAQRHESTGLFDIGFSSVAQLEKDTAELVQRSGLMREFVSWREWDRYKYHVDIDGNSSPWSNLFQRFLAGSTVLKVESSRGLVQWYYDELRPWRNYVPIAPDMSDLLDKLKWLQRNDRVAESVGRNGLELAERLSYERELDRSVSVISSAFRYFNGRAGDLGPYGRAGRAPSLTFTQPYWTNVRRFGGDF